ncbi:MAG: UDP-N-acetylmuramate:L-alanyl-gamma-D-glutamyl-meso-diaminopimelate ligase [Deltaproteobacteria bacterium]|nr:UDP-N-acetylmuramate:L-alanyl-gamma-D-glutamyl-meso-diaminopimelate ligase [Deltaproteobacteria bacterium]MBI4374003.1 UDP-N-acetylmuramate:L-alanyl-gamma-D-glutamyl-meso-diaminopimelate ligase [Deltaproteobacteria bacterium]
MKIHLIAIGGMGMGSLAGLLKAKGFQVSGSDLKIYPPMSTQLERLEIKVHEEFDPKNLVPKPDLVIVGNAVSKTNPEVQALLESGIPYLSMPAALDQFFLKDRRSLVVAGTHGKTTTSALAAWLLEKTGFSPGFLVGGVLKNLNLSCRLGEGRCFVVEGDEYDTAFFDKGPKFLHYHPDVLILNPIEFDHADIYRDLPHLLSSFQRLVEKMPRSGLVIADGRNENVRSLFPRVPCRIITFGTLSNTDARAENLAFRPDGTAFDVVYKKERLGGIASPLIGRHNVENLLAVIVALLEEGIPFQKLKEAIGGFQGVKRRQEVLGRFAGITIIDDFAHHPTAIYETLKAVRQANPKSPIWAVFEPRSNTTRRNVFQNDFPAAFEEADHTLLAPVYRPEKIALRERLDPELIVQALRAKAKEALSCHSTDEIIHEIVSRGREGEIVCLMSNGGFDNLASRLIRRLEERG